MPRVPAPRQRRRRRPGSRASPGALRRPLHRVASRALHYTVAPRGQALVGGTNEPAAFPCADTTRVHPVVFSRSAGRNRRLLRAGRGQLNPLRGRESFRNCHEVGWRRPGSHPIHHPGTICFPPVAAVPAAPRPATKTSCRRSSCGARALALRWWCSKQTAARLIGPLPFSPTSLFTREGFPGRRRAPLHIQYDWLH